MAETTPLPLDFPARELLEAEGYETIEDVQEAPDEELLAIKGIADKTLEAIRAKALFTGSDKEGADSTSGASSTPSAPSDESELASRTGNNPNTGSDSVMPDRETSPTPPGGGSVGTNIERREIRGRGPSRRTEEKFLGGKPHDFGEGIHLNERGTVTATTAATHQPDIVTTEQAAKMERERMRVLRGRMESLFDGDI